MLRGIQLNPSGLYADFCVVDLGLIGQQFHHLDWTAFLLAIAVGGAIGIEREVHGRPAGVRTHMLVCLSAAILIQASQSASTALGESVVGNLVFDPNRLAAGIVTGIGFLGAATVIRSGDIVRGITTGACVWAVAVLGIVIGQRHYALAIAGGCAIVSACDLVVVSATARLGYPVHRIGLSLAVTIATLQQAIGPGAARATLLGGQLFDGANACRIGLAARLCPDDASVHTEAIRLCRSIAAHGPQALRATKRWLNELDGSLDDERFDRPAQDSAATCTEEARAMLARQVRKNLDGQHS